MRIAAKGMIAADGRVNALRVARDMAEYQVLMLDYMALVELQQLVLRSSAREPAPGPGNSPSGQRASQASACQDRAPDWAAALPAMGDRLRRFWLGDRGDCRHG